MLVLHAWFIVSMSMSMSVDDLDELQCSWMMVYDGRRCWLDDEIVNGSDGDDFG